MRGSVKWVKQVALSNERRWQTNETSHAIKQEEQQTSKMNLTVKQERCNKQVKWVTLLVKQEEVANLCIKQEEVANKSHHQMRGNGKWVMPSKERKQQMILAVKQEEVANEMLGSQSNWFLFCWWSISDVHSFAIVWISFRSLVDWYGILIVELSSSWGHSAPNTIWKDPRQRALINLLKVKQHTQHNNLVPCQIA